MEVQFTALKKQAKPTPKYDDKSVWKCKKKLNETLKTVMGKQGLKSHGSWKIANELLVQEQEPKERELWREYIGPISKELILKRREAIEEGKEELAKELKKEIRKQEERTEERAKMNKSETI